MKILISAAAAAMALASAPALAHAETTVYGSIGYANIDVDPVTLGAIQGRLGGQINEHFAVEGEFSIGVADDDVLGTSVELNKEFGLFAVGILPVSDTVSLNARVGWVDAELNIGGTTDSSDGTAYGVGAQVNFSPRDGIRLDYTRYELDSSADVWSLAYVRKF